MTPRSRRDPFLWSAALVLAVVSLLPVWGPRLLPMLDQPNHLAAIQVWNKLADPTWGLQRFYESSTVPVPYWGYYFPVHVLSSVLDVEVANKLFLSVYVLAIPASVAYLASSLGRSGWVCLLVFPLAFNHSWAWGFLSYVPGMPLVLFSLGLLARYFRLPTNPRLAAFFAALTATYFMHLLPWIALGALATLYVVGQLRPWSRSVRVAGVLLASLLFAVWNTVYCAETHRTVDGHFRVQAAWLPFLQVVRELPSRILQRWDGALVANGVTVVLGLSLLALAWTGRNEPRSGRSFIERWFPELCAGLMLGAYLFMPVKLVQPAWIWFVNTRYLALAGLFAAVLVRGPIEGRRRLLLLPAVLASLFYMGALAKQYLDFNTRAAGIVEVMKSVPRGSNTLTLLLGGNTDPALDAEYVPYNEYHSYPTVWSGGYDAYGWDLGFPYRMTQHLPTPRWNAPAQFSQRAHGRFFDFVLTHNEPRDHSVFPGREAKVPLVAHAGTWRLYRTLGVE